jgi:hypothetical protein
MRIVYWLWYERKASLNLESMYILPLAEADKSSRSLLLEQVLLAYCTVYLMGEKNSLIFFFS